MVVSIYQKFAIATASLVVFGLEAVDAKSVQASIFADPFSSSYSSQSLGPINLISGGNVPASYGGLTFLDADTLLIGGNANELSAAIYAVDVIRNSSTNRITGYAGPATFFANAPGINSLDPNATSGGIDGGLTIGPGGVVFYSTYGDNSIGQIKPGSTGPDKFIDLTSLGITPSTGGVAFVPDGFPGAGRLKITSYDDNHFYDAVVTPDGNGTFDISIEGDVDLERADRSRGLEGIAYVDASYPGFAAPSILLSEFNSQRVISFEVDALGNPITSTEQDFIVGFPRSGGPEGLVVDPLTGDILLSVYGNELESQVLLITPEAPEPTIPDNNPFDPISSIDLSSGSGLVSGTASTGNQVFSFMAQGGNLLTLDIDVTDILSGTAYTNDDTVLYLYDSEGRILAVGEDKDESLASRILNYLITEDGTYYAAVTTAGNEPILQLGSRFNTLLGFENNGLGNVAFDLSVSSTILPETARLFDIALPDTPSNPFGSFLIDGDQVLFVDLNGSRNTDVTGPLTVIVNPDDYTLTFDNFEFVLQFPGPFPSTDINDIIDIFDEVVVTAIIPPDELIQDIVFSERQEPGQSVPEPTFILGLFAFAGASSVLRFKKYKN